MSELLVSPVAEIVLRKLGSIAYQQVFLLWGVKKDLLKLENTSTTINAVLLDAEHQQFHNRELRVWLEKLKDVCYDAEDVLSEFEAESLRGSNSSKVWNLLPHPKSLTFRFMIAHKMKGIRERLDEIAVDKLKFHLNINRDYSLDVSKQREMTHSFVFASDVIGRDKNKQEIIQLLMQPEPVDDDQNVSVVPIVGIGGLGKTALAKLVYNDKRIDEYFDLKMWICVSDDFVEKKIMIKIINSATSKKPSNMDIDQLQKVLRDILSGKRYLLIMDDVWNEDARKWIDFKKLLLGGANGSKIIVTTRSNRVASIMGTMRCANEYRLEGLSYESCLSLFMKCAFKEGEDKHWRRNCEKMWRSSIGGENIR
ncbi:hypothetical protein Dsin_028277 [Dipteronia sinensis]|uniref:Disease resistance protein RGA3 n=1 Tax=Dipteronia sinensis TaxID=43782 RepID=A0AAD9ZRR0_9ROSI|nr:hypothetical protein Dsin_028277 [Dipteronia sinensis]